MRRSRKHPSSSLPRRLHPRALCRSAKRCDARGASFAALICSALLLSWGSGCKKSGTAHALGGLGKPLASGSATDLRLTPDRKTATYLTQADKPRLEGVPQQMVIGLLNAVSVDGGLPRKLGSGVTNLPGGYLFSPDSRWAVFLSGYNAANRSGELNLLDLRAATDKPHKVGSQVTYMLVSPDSRWLAFVDGGLLKVGPLPDGPFKELAGEVSTAEFTPNSQALLLKRKISAGGALLSTPLGQWNVQKLGEQVGDYQVSPDSAKVAFARQSATTAGGYDLFIAAPIVGAPRVSKVSGGTGLFLFSPDGKWLARTEGWNVEQKRGDLYLGTSKGEAGRKIGEKVGDRLSFAPDSTAIAYLELWDEPSRSGLMGVTELPEGEPRRVGGRVPNFGWGSNGRYLAFLSRFVKPVYSVDLMLYRMGDESSFKVNAGVFAYGFGPNNAYFLFRTNCIREGRACDLYALDLEKPKERPRKIVEGIYSFKVPDAGDRMLVTYAQTQSDTYDVAAYNLKSGEHRTLDQHIRLPAMFAAPDGSKAAYVIAEPSRAGVYLAEQLP